MRLASIMSIVVDVLHTTMVMQDGLSSGHHHSRASSQYFHTILLRKFIPPLLHSVPFKNIILNLNLFNVLEAVQTF